MPKFVYVREYSFVSIVYLSFGAKREAPEPHLIREILDLYTFSLELTLVLQQFTLQTCRAKFACCNAGYLVRFFLE